MAAPIAIALSLSASSCGWFGELEPTLNLVEFSTNATGCLNEIGTRFEDYFEGKIDEPGWRSTWSCAIDALQLFRRFVRATPGPDGGGYQLDDLQSFVSRFLVTGKPVTRELIARTFELKASILGGSPLRVSDRELDRFSQLLRVGRDTSAGLLTLMRRRALHPSPDELKALAAGIAAAADSIASELERGRGGVVEAPLTAESLEALFLELSNIYGWRRIEGLGGFAMALKALALSGSFDEMEGHRWVEGIRKLGRLGGAGLAFWSRSGDRALGMDLFRLVSPELVSSINGHASGGVQGISVDTWLRVFERLPDAWWPSGTFSGATRAESIAIIRKFFPIALSRLLRSTTDTHFDLASWRTLESQLALWDRGRLMLSEAAARAGAVPLGASREEWLRAFADLRADSRWPTAEWDRLALLVTRYPATHQGEDTILYLPMSRVYSEKGIGLLHEAEILSRLIQQGWGTRFADQEHRLLLSDAETLFRDILPLAGALRKMDPSVPNLHLKRFREANFFMTYSNGDEMVDHAELTEYMPYLNSIRHLSDRVVEAMVPVCENGQGVDAYGVPWMDIGCFRREFFNRRGELLDHFPMLVRFMDRLSPDRVQSLHDAMERGARRFGKTDRPIGRYDVETYAVGLQHYVETFFQRYDRDGNETLNLSEAMRAYPVFKGEIATQGKLDPRFGFLIEGAFTYVVHHGEAPKKNPIGLARFGAWLATKPAWGLMIRADRLSGYRIISAMNQPEQQR